MIIYRLFRGFELFLSVLRYGLLIYCILSWFVPATAVFMQLAARVFDPIVRPVRTFLFRKFPRMPIDIAPVVVYLVLNLASTLLWWLYRFL